MNTDTLTLERPAAPDTIAPAFVAMAVADIGRTQPLIAGLLVVSEWLERVGRPVSRRRTTIRVHGLLLIAHWLGQPEAGEAVKRAAAKRDEIAAQHAAAEKARSDRVIGLSSERRGTWATPYQLEQIERLSDLLAVERRPDERAKIERQRSDILDQIERQGERAANYRRRAELASLEAQRGGELLIEETTVDVPVLRDGVPVRRLGVAVTRQEVVTKIRATSRDGLDTLATGHLTAAGERRKLKDGSYMKPLFLASQLAALERYREEFQDRREISLRAVDATEAGGDRTPFNVQRSLTLERLVSDALQQKEAYKKGRAFEQAEAAVSRIAGRDALRVLRLVAGEGHTIRSLAPGRRKAIRYTKALLAAADVLADRFGMT